MSAARKSNELWCREAGDQAEEVLWVGLEVGLQVTEHAFARQVGEGPLKRERLGCLALLGFANAGRELDPEVDAGTFATGRLSFEAAELAGDDLEQLAGRPTVLVGGADCMSVSARFHEGQ